MRRAVGGDLRGLRVAYSPDFGYAAVDPQVRRVVDRAATVFERDLDCIVERADPGGPTRYDSFWGVVVSDSDLAGYDSSQTPPRRADESTPHRCPTDRVNR